MPSEFLTTKRQGYQAQRAASQGAGITLTCGAEEYTAQFECAQRINKLLPQIKLCFLAKQGEAVPFIRVPLPQMHEVCTKLSASCSIALVDHTRDQYKESRFYCVWRIPCSGIERPILIDPPQPSKNVDDY